VAAKVNTVSIAVRSGRLSGQNVYTCYSSTSVSLMDVSLASSTLLLDNKLPGPSFSSALRRDCISLPLALKVTAM